MWHYKAMVMLLPITQFCMVWALPNHIFLHFTAFLASLEEKGLSLGEKWHFHGALRQP